MKNLFFIKVDQPGDVLYLHPLEDGYEVRDKMVGAALWKDEAAAILAIKKFEEWNPGVKFKLEKLIL
jgi:hypothetical protein